MSTISPEAPLDQHEGEAPPVPKRRIGGGFGPLTGGRVLILVAAMAFLAGAVGYAVGARSDDPLNATDVSFIQDMGYHHEQAVQMSILLLGKDGVDRDLKSYATEILVGQRYEIGLMNATVDRFGYPYEPGTTAMGWMGMAVPLDQMPGLATDAQMAQLRAATGSRAAALFISLMSEHHLAGITMADAEVARGKDQTTVNMARGMVATQRGEVIDLDRYRRTHDLPLVAGFTDPLQDSRLNPPSLTGS